MQDRPDKAALLEAIAAFLMGEVGPRVSDKALGFRVLIAANLAQIVAAECRAEDACARAELDRLAGLLGEEAVAPARARSGAERDRAIEALERRMLELDGSPGGPLWAHVKQTLAEKLRVANPRFDLGL